MRVTTDDGVGLATVAVGDPEAPGLLLLHGIGGAKEDFAHHLDALAARHRVVTFDHRGHGESDKPDDERAYFIESGELHVLETTLAETIELLVRFVGADSLRGHLLHDDWRERIASDATLAWLV